MSEKVNTPFRDWDHSPKKMVKQTADGKNDLHMTATGRIEKILEERELRKLEAEVDAA